MSFKDIKGQEQPIKILQESLRQAHLEGSYLFVGPQGLGKRLVAQTLAKAVNCQKENADACDACVSCLKIENNQHPDVHFITSVDSEAIKIEDIRNLQKNINLRPYEAKQKVFIINNAHNLTPEAANALLKILEEPPKNSLIILITAKPTLLFKTIISRCKIIKFSPLKRTELEEILTKDYALDNNSAHFLAYFSEGRIGYALKLKEEDFLSQKNRIIDDFIFSGSPALENLSRKNMGQLRSILNILAGWFRDIYLIKIGIPHRELINLDRKPQILKVMTRYSLFDLEEILHSISDSLLYLEQNVNVKLLFANLRWALKT